MSVSKLDKNINSALLIVIEVLAIRYDFERLGSDLRQLGGPFTLMRSWRFALQIVDLHIFGGAEQHRKSIEALFQSFHEVTSLTFLKVPGPTDL